MNFHVKPNAAPHGAWTTRLEPEITRAYGVEELHTVYFVPPDWPGHGPTVSLELPECGLLCAIRCLDGEPLAMVNKPTAKRNIKQWMRSACEMAVELQAVMMFACNTADQAVMAAKRAARLLPNYKRLPLERMYDPAARVAAKLS